MTAAMPPRERAARTAAAGGGAPAGSPSGRSQGAAAALLLACLLLLPACQGPPAKDAGDRGAAGQGGYPLGYSLGTFDARFGIPVKEFLGVVDEAAAVWEKAAGRDLFRFDSGAPFRVNLVFDERQERTIEAKRVKSRIDSRGRSYDALVWQHAGRMERLRESERRCDEAEAAVRARLDEHNAKVGYWNARGGAPEAEYAALGREREEIEESRKAAERLRDDLNGDVAAVNDLVVQINEIARANNIEVTYFNGKFVESREFEQGVYSGSDITIYQFSDRSDLRMALVHELGHALGFRHVDDPTAVMYFKLGGQDLVKPALGPADLALLKKKFGGG